MKKTISQWFENMENQKVLVIGDVMIDVYIYGKVDRISPEAPVPVVNIEKQKTCLGGAANVAINLQALGATPILCSVVGNDIKGCEFINILNDRKLPSQGMLTIDGRVTTTKSRIIGNNSQQILRIDEEIESPISEEETNRLYELAKTIIEKENVDAIIFEDYDKGVITPALIEKISDLASQKSIFVCVDPKKRNFLNYKNITLFKPNLQELCLGLNLDKNNLSIEALTAHIKQFMDENKLQIVMTTLSEKGILICYYNGSDYAYDWLPAHLRNIADVSGAGDTVISVATLCLSLKIHPSKIAAISNLAGGLVCEYMGVVPVDKQKLYKETLSLLS